MHESILPFRTLYLIPRRRLAEFWKCDPKVQNYLNFLFGVKFIIIKIEDRLSVFPTCLVTCLLLFSCSFFWYVFRLSNIPFLLLQVIAVLGSDASFKVCRRSNEENEP